MKQNEKIILASQSPRRKELLEQLGLALTIMPSEIAEVGYGGSPDKIPSRIVTQKIKAVKAKLGMDFDGCLLAADTIVALGNEVFGKPENTDHAKTMLKQLSGKTHAVYTCFRMETLEGDFVEKTIRTDVKMRKISEEMLNWYLSMNEPYDKAGAYAIQGHAGIFVESINGSYSNVVGLPLAEVMDAFVQMKIVTF